MKFKKGKLTSNDTIEAITTATTMTKQNSFRIKRYSNKLATKFSIFKQIMLCLAALQLTNFISIINAYNNHHPGSPFYDSENQVGTIGSPTAQWRYDDHQDEDSQNVPVSRRVSDTDLDDGLEEEDDEDRDDYAKSGSINRGQYVEDPAFGESDRAARDGDDIEGFFDKHLGPQAAIEADNNSEDDHEVPISASPRSGIDHYETAASSPLSNIFHSLLNAHKRPFIIHTTEEDPNTGNSNDSQQSTSSSTPVGSSIRGSPQATTYAVPSGYAAPIAYYTPVASSSSYDQSGSNTAGPGQEAQTQEAGNQAGNSGQEEYAPVREIFISRRPTVMNHYQAYAPASQQGLEHQSSNAYWRGSAATTGHRPYGDDQGDYARYPVAASYAYQREQQSALPDEEQTLSFGLSFGGRPSESADDDSQENPSSVDESGYEPGYGSRDSMLRHSSTMRSYNNYNYSPMVAQGYTRAPPGATIVMPQQQSPYHGAKYHRDPSESSAQPVNYGQYSGSSSALTPITRENRQWITRQNLLANLDRQIKNNPSYRRLGSDQQLAASPAMNKVYRQQADTFRSFNSEMDPFKSFTTTSRVLKEPAVNGASDNNNNNSNNNNNRGTVQPLNNHLKNDSNRLQATTYGDSKSPVSKTYKSFNADRSIENRNVAPTQAQNAVTDGDNVVAMKNKRQYGVENLMTGPVNVENSAPRQNQITNTGSSREPEGSSKINRRVRREDSDDRETEDPDDDGVWVDDDEDDDNKQQSSDVNETSQQPEGQEEDAQHDVPLHTPALVPGMHGYDIAPEDPNGSLMVYPG